MSRLSVWFVVFFLFPFSEKGDCCRGLLISAEQKPAEELVSRWEVQEENPESQELRAFNVRKQETLDVPSLVYSLFMIVAVGFSVALIFIYLFYEPSHASTSYKSTKVKRPDDYVPYQRSSSEHFFDD